MACPRHERNAISFFLSFLMTVHLCTCRQAQYSQPLPLAFPCRPEGLPSIPPQWRSTQKNAQCNTPGPAQDKASCTLDDALEDIHIQNVMQAVSKPSPGLRDRMHESERGASHPGSLKRKAPELVLRGW